MIVPGMFVYSSFLISVCMFIVSKALLISSATVIVRAGGAIWLNPFATVLFSVCSAVTVECCVLYPCCMGVFGMFANRCTLSQFRTYKCPILNSYLKKITHTNTHHHSVTSAKQQRTQHRIYSTAPNSIQTSRS